MLQYIGCTAEDFAHIPEGEPVLRLSAEDGRGPTWTLYMRSLRKSLIQREAEVVQFGYQPGRDYGVKSQAEINKKKPDVTVLLF